MKTTRPLYWFIHHEYIVEPASEPIENRIAYIKSDKKQAQHAVRLAALQPVKHPELLPGDWLKATVNWQKACADWQKVSADWQKVSADWEQVSADWEQVSADWEQVSADLESAAADWQKAYADWQKAHAALQKAYAAHLPALVARYLIEYPENAKLFNHATGHLIFP